MTNASPVMTVLEARVSPDRAPELQRRYTDAAGSLPSQMLQALLVQSTTDPAVWRGIAIWRSRAALEEYRRSVATPAGIMMFRAVGAEPSPSVWDVAAYLPS